MEEQIKRLIEKYKFMSETFKECGDKVFLAKAETYDLVIENLEELLEGDTNAI